MDKNPALQQTAQIFAPGTLQQKHDQISLLQASGNSMLFSGEVAWKVIIPDADQVLKGDAEGLDEALSMMKALLAEAMKTHSPTTKVTLAVTEKQI